MCSFAIAAIGPKSHRSKLEVLKIAFAKGAIRCQFLRPHGSSYIAEDPIARETKQLLSDKNSIADVRYDNVSARSLSAQHSRIPRPSLKSENYLLSRKAISLNLTSTRLSDSRPLPRICSALITHGTALVKTGLWNSNASTASTSASAAVWLSSVPGPSSKKQIADGVGEEVPSRPRICNRFCK